MPLSFPTSPSLNQLYSSGSSAIYQWNGSYWDIQNPTSLVASNIISSSFAVSSSFTPSKSGTVLNKKVYNLSSFELSTDITPNVGFTSGYIEVNYSPVSPSSSIIFHTDVAMNISYNTQNASWRAQMEVDNVTFQNRIDRWYGLNGGDGRGGMNLNPIYGQFSNTDLTTKTLRCTWSQIQLGETLTFTGNALITIEEIQL